MIAVDAMGGDFAPRAVVHGAFLAASRGISLRLYGDSVQLIPLLDQLDPAWQRLPILIVHCSEVFGMEDEPAQGFVQKKDSSLVRAAHAVANGEAQALFSAGNTGAGLVSGMMILGKVPGIMRPALGEFLPTQTGSVFFIDLGANVDCKPEHLEQFAVMGHVYVTMVKHIQNPKIALLANGAESSKGSKNTLQAYQLLKQSSLHFIGNREPADILAGAADVVVCDGFTGNIMLKTIEAMAEAIPAWIRTKAKKSPFIGRFISFIGTRLIDSMKKKLTSNQQAGALLLGLNKPLIIAHGSSDAHAIERALMFAHSVITSHLITRFNQALSAQLMVNEKTSAQPSAQTGYQQPSSSL